MLALALALSVAAAPTPARPFTVDDLLALERAGEPTLSPDGKLVAYTVSRAAPGGEKLVSALWVVPAAGGAPRRLTDGDERVAAPAFSPDGRRIAYAVSRKGGRQAFVQDLAGGAAVQATDLPGGVSELLWAPDGRSLLVTSDVDPACGADAECNRKAAEAAEKRPHVATRLLFRHWTEWRERVRSHLLVVPLDGGPVRDLTPGDRDVPPFQRGGDGDLALSTDGKTVYFVAISDPVEAISTNGDVYAVPLAGGEARRLTSGPGWDGSPRPSPDGKRVAWLSQANAGAESDKFRVMVAAADGSGARDLTAALDLSAEGLWWARGGKALRFTALAAGRTELYEVDVASGRIEKLGPGVDLAAVVPSRDGDKAVALVDGMRTPPEVALLEGGKGGKLAVRTLARPSAPGLAGIALATVKPLEATGRDGARIFGWVVLPPDLGAGERRPGVVLVHGGPQGAWKDGWSYRWNPLLYAARGYVVVLPNPRGSSGYGLAYEGAVRNDWGGLPFDDIMRLTDAAVAAGLADPDRLCAAGASYGGYMTNWINGHTDRFKCLVTHAGDFDAEAAYYDTEELWFPEWEMGRPYDDPEPYLRWSPHRFVARWKTPTLVTHGELDYRVTITQGLSTFTALQRRGIPSRLVVFPDEGHWILKPRNAKVFHEEVFGWIDRWIGPAAAQASAR